MIEAQIKSVDDWALGRREFGPRYRWDDDAGGLRWASSLLMSSGASTARCYQRTPRTPHTSAHRQLRRAPSHCISRPGVPTSPVSSDFWSGVAWRRPDQPAALPGKAKVTDVAGCAFVTRCH